MQIKTGNKALYLGFILFLIILINASALLAASITLSWTPPTTNVDGTSLTDLAGYKLYFGNSSGNYIQSIDIGNTTSYAITNLAPGSRYYLVITAYDIFGNESAPSNEASKIASTSNGSLSAPSIVDLSTTYSTQSIMTSNTGTAPLSITSIFIDGQNASEFIIKDVNGCSAKTLQPAETCSLDIDFVPLSIGLKSASLFILSNDPNTPVFTVSLSGTADSLITPVAKVSVNGKEGYIKLKRGREADMTLEVDPKSYIDVNGDWWLLLKRKSDSRWYYYDPVTEKWLRGRSAYDQKPLSTAAIIQTMKTANLPSGSYNLYFGVDTNLNGSRDFGQYYYDVMKVRIVE